MTQEIIYTSAPEGLKPGSHGFCTVISTSGMARNLAMKLESMSAYRHAFPPHTTAARFNPVNYSHLKIQIGGRGYHVLSRIADAGQDYTQRSNKLAHHVALDQSEIIPVGPAAILATEGFSCTQWDGKVQLVPPRKVPAPPIAPSGPCQAWKQVSGDAGWAGVVANQLLTNADKPVSVIFPKGTDTLSLVCEVFSLLPEDKRWRTTFSTYFTKLPAGLDCQLRFVLDETGEATALRRHPHALVIDLAKPATVSENNPLISLARTGEIERPHPPVAPRPSTAAPAVSPHTHSPEDSVSLEITEEDLVSDKPPAPPESAAGVYHFPNPQAVTGGQQTPHTASWQARQQADFSNRKRRRTKIIYFVAGGSGLILLLLLTFLIGSWFGKNQQASVPSEEDKKTAPVTIATIEEAVPEPAAVETEEQSLPPVAPETSSSEETAKPPKAEMNSAKTKEPEPATPQPNPKKQEKHNPFQDPAFQKRVLALPEWEQKQTGDLRKSGKNEKWFPLAKLNLLPEESLLLEIIGGKTLLSNSNSDFEVVPDSRSNAPRNRWIIQYPLPPSSLEKNTTPIAELKLNEGILSFKWNSKNLHDDLLRYASLKLMVGDQSLICQLRNTIKTEPLQFGKGKDQQLLEINFPFEQLSTFKKIGYKVFIEIISCDSQKNGPVACQFMTDPPHILESQYKLIFPMDFNLDTDDSSLKAPPQFRVELSLEEKKKKEYTLLCKLYGAPKYLQSSFNEGYDIISAGEGQLWTSEYGDEVVNHRLGKDRESSIKKSLDEKRKQLNDVFKKLNNSNANNKNDLQKEYDKKEKDLKIATSMLSHYPEQRKFFEETFGPESTGCRIHYRLFLKLEDHEIDLYRSREN
ncbi:hypothetical protein [Gimesia sp.]|uniref:GAP1-N2 domain-containing protein n=1 Tax=Gimesia sp. TaxID=2024833 RepID=UPI003A93F452